MDRLANEVCATRVPHHRPLLADRAALLSGRNHHSAATGIIMEFGTGSRLQLAHAEERWTFAEILKQNGYNTSWYGKNHNVPDWQNSQAGPFDLWPTGLGFEHFYGFIGGDTNQWNPALFEGTKPIEPPHDAKDYLFDKDMADHAIAWLRMQHAVAPDKPFLAYYAPVPRTRRTMRRRNGRQVPGQVRSRVDKVREETFARQKQMGIIPANAKLTERPPGIPAWIPSTLTTRRSRRT